VNDNKISWKDLLRNRGTLPMPSEKMPLLPTPRARDGNCGDSAKGIIHNFKRGYLDGTIAVFLALLADDPVCGPSKVADSATNNYEVIGD